jgi:hypothetical protein
LKITRPVLPTVSDNADAPSTVFWNDKLPLLELKFVGGSQGLDVSYKSERPDAAQLVFDGISALLAA